MVEGEPKIENRLEEAPVLKMTFLRDPRLAEVVEGVKKMDVYQAMSLGEELLKDFGDQGYAIKPFFDFLKYLSATDVIREGMSEDLDTRFREHYERAAEYNQELVNFIYPMTEEDDESLVEFWGALGRFVVKFWPDEGVEVLNNTRTGALGQVALMRALDDANVMFTLPNAREDAFYGVDLWLGDREIPVQIKVRSERDLSAVNVFRIDQELNVAFADSLYDKNSTSKQIVYFDNEVEAVGQFGPTFDMLKKCKFQFGKLWEKEDKSMAVLIFMTNHYFDNLIGEPDKELSDFITSSLGVAVDKMRLDQVLDKRGLKHGE